MGANRKLALVIPARFESSRYPGKPLADILGQPMIQHVWSRCCAALPQSDVFIATDDSRIAKVSEGFGAQVVLTSPNCLTGTDRIAQANEQLAAKWIINVQGDEPMVDPESIKLVLEALLSGDTEVVNGMEPIHSADDFFSADVPKIVVDSGDRLLYASRAPVPLSKSREFKGGAFRQVCIYGFSAASLAAFSAAIEKTPNESIEDIEILRFLELGYPVQMVKLSGSTVAVDRPEDVSKVEELLRES